MSLLAASPAVERNLGSPGPPLACPITVLPSNGTTSGNERAPNSNFLFGRAVYLITAAELAASGLASGASPGAIGWHYATAPGVSASGNLTVYLENTSDATNTKSDTWATAIAGMTVVHSAPTSLPDTTTPFDIPFSGGSPFTYTGGALYVAFDWSWDGPSTMSAIVACSTTLADGLRGGQSNVAAPATVSVSPFRPETRLSPTVGNANDAAVDLVVSMGSLPSGLVGPQTVQAVVSNRGSSIQTDLPVTLSLTGAQVFTDVQTIPSLAACTGSAMVSFLPFTPSAIGSSTVSVSVPPDDLNANNIETKPLDVTSGRYSYKYPGSTADGGTGFTDATGIFVAQFTTTSATQIDTVIVEFFEASFTAYRLAIYGDAGGSPGGLLYQDAVNRTVPAPGSFTLRPPSTVPVGPGSFYVGIQQRNMTNASHSFDIEDPIRAGRFFMSTTIPAITWIDFAEAPPLTFKLNIGIVVGERIDPLTVDVIPDSASVCEGGSIQLTCSTSGGVPPVTYQWTENGVDIDGATSSTYTATNAPGASFFNCKVTDNGGNTNVQDATATTVTVISDGETCDDGNLCTRPDTCTSGVCQPGPNPCLDGNECTVDVCDAIGECTHSAVDCNDGNVCTDDSCAPLSGCLNEPNSLPCSGNNPCTFEDMCSGGVCVPGTPPTVQVCNTEGITIDDGSPPTPATLYPGTIAVSGAGPVTCSVEISLSGLGHTSPDDVDMLLVGPVGQNAIILSDVGGGNPVSGVSLTLADSAAASLPEAGTLTSGTFKPTDITVGTTGTELWPSPAPLPSGGSALSVFNGTNPNGNWGLFIVDDDNPDSGGITEGWCVTVASAPCIQNIHCDDGNACTTDTCSAGQCTGTPVTASATGLRIGTTCTSACTDKHTIAWDVVPEGFSCDIIFGDLQTLHSSGLSASTAGCLGDDLPTPTFEDGAAPFEDQGFWYLVRCRDCAGGGGTYDEGGNQAAPRDSLIPAPPIDCSHP